MLPEERDDVDGSLRGASEPAGSLSPSGNPEPTVATSGAGALTQRWGGRPPGGQMGAVDGRWKYIRDDSGAELLFDLIADPDERVDRAADHPGLVDTLRARVVDWEAFGTRLIPDYAALLQASECASTP